MDALLLVDAVCGCGDIVTAAGAGTFSGRPSYDVNVPSKVLWSAGSCMSAAQTLLSIVVGIWAIWVVSTTLRSFDAAATYLCNIMPTRTDTPTSTPK